MLVAIYAPTFGNLLCHSNMPKKGWAGADTCDHCRVTDPGMNVDCTLTEDKHQTWVGFLSSVKGALISFNGCTPPSGQQLIIAALKTCQTWQKGHYQVALNEAWIRTLSTLFPINSWLLCCQITSPLWFLKHSQNWYWISPHWVGPIFTIWLNDFSQGRETPAGEGDVFLNFMKGSDEFWKCVTWNRAVHYLEKLR